MSCKSVKPCLIRILPALFLLFLQPARAQETWTNLTAELESQKKTIGNDLVMMVWKRGDTLVYKKEMGALNTKTAVPIGDASRWFTAALIMQFVDEGKLSLDDKISKWIPEFARYGKNYITIRTCLSNMTGVADEEKGLKKLFQKKKFESLEEEVNSYASREIRANPTQDFWYGNIGINCAGRVLEIISKKRFDVLIKQKLFNPMTMRRSSFTTLDGGPVNPSSGANTTGDDYMRFLAMLLNNGKFAGKQVLTEESVGKLMELQTKPELIKFAPKEVRGLNYALGSWILEERGGKPTVLAALGFSGTWPVIDLIRGYAFLLMPKEFIEEEKMDGYMHIKSVVDEQFPVR